MNEKASRMVKLIRGVPREHAQLVFLGIGLLFSLILFREVTGLERDSHLLWIVFFIPFLVYLIAIMAISNQRSSENIDVRNSGKTRASQARLLGIILIFAILFRAVFLFSTPVMSDDIYRYYWEGKMTNNGINPYEYAPDDPELIEYRDDEWEDINNKDVPASYPPLTQIIFSASYFIHPSIFFLKCVYVFFDLLTIPVIFLILRKFNMDPRLSIIYAWSPLVIMEFAHSGHNDSLAIFLTTLSFLFLQKEMKSASALSLAFGFLTKLFPMLFAPLLFRRWGWKNTLLYFAVIVAFYLPFMNAGLDLFSGTSTYADRWLFNGSIFPILVHGFEFLMSGEHALFLAKALILVTFGFALLFLLLSRPDRTDGMVLDQKRLFKQSFWLLGLYLILTPTFHPWYIIWLIPFLCVFNERSWIILSGLVVLSYTVYIEFDSHVVWQEVWWARALEYVPFYLLLVYELRRYGGWDTLRSELMKALRNGKEKLMMTRSLHTKREVSDES